MQVPGFGPGGEAGSEAPGAALLGTSPSASSSIQKSQAVREIFAGSRMSSANDVPKDPWVVLPRKSSRIFNGSGAPGPSGAGSSSLRQAFSPGTIGPGTIKSLKKGRRMSRNLDAILDDPSTPDVDLPQGANDDAEKGMETTFNPARPRGRGLSDSSIHTTFMNHGAQLDPAQGAVTTSSSNPLIPARLGAFPISIFPERPSMFQALSQRVQSLASSVSGNSSIQQTPARDRERERERERERTHSRGASDREREQERDRILEREHARLADSAGTSPRMGFIPRDPADGLM